MAAVEKVIHGARAYEGPSGSGTVGGRVIQGFFVGGAMRPLTLQRTEAERRQAAPGPGAPPPAFAARAASIQPRTAPGRPAPAHAAQVAQRHGGTGSFAIDAAAVGLARTGGKALPPAVLAKMEAAFGADFSAVRVHVGPQASRIGAIAFTTGTDLYFAPGQYQPESIKGQQLIGHELAHVVQQRQGRVRAPGSGVAVVQDRMLEAEADRLGMQAAAHRVPVQAKTAGRGEATVHIAAPGSNAPGSYRLTAGSGASPIGSLVVHTRRGAAAEVTDLGVDPRFRDRGVGRQLLVSAARAGLRSGNSKLSLSAQDNGSGRLTRWYKDLGFHQVGVNNRGMPMLEAPISRLLGATVQRRASGTIQRAAAFVAPVSGFANTAATCSGQIYGIWQNEQFPNKIKDSSLEPDKCLYVGKTNASDEEIGVRFIQHVKCDSDCPWHIDHCKYSDEHHEIWPYVVRNLWMYKNITAFDVAVAEQYFIQKLGTSKFNKIAALTLAKFNQFKDDPTVFTTMKYYKDWKPVK